MQNDLFNTYYDITGDYIKKQVIRIENKIPTTQNRYGDYLNLLTALISEKIPKNICYDLIIKCGGNKQGVSDAYKIINQ